MLLPSIQKLKIVFLFCAFCINFVCDGSTLIEKVVNYVHRTQQSDNSTKFVQPSLFPNIPPYVKFATYYRNASIEIPPALSNGLIWRRSTILNSGGYVVHYIMNMTGIPALKLSSIEKLEPNISWFGYWYTMYTSTLIGPPAITKPYQKYSYFQLSEQLEHKDKQHWNLMRLINKHGREELPFYMDTFVLPEQMEEFKLAWNNTENKLWIIKPTNGYASIGVRLISHWREVPADKVITVQKYLHNPYLFSGRKIEIRNYVVTTSFNPLRAYIFNDGDTKIGYKKYTSDPKQMDDLCIHSRPWDGHTFCAELDDIDDSNENFVQDFNFWENSKMYKRLAVIGVDVEKLQERMHDYIVKTLLSVEKVIGKASREKYFNNYNAFQIWAFDFIPDENLQPWILEINSGPDQTVNGDSDIRVQFPFVQGTLNLVGYHFPPFLNEEAKEILRKNIGAAPVADPTFASIEKLYTFDLTEEDELKQSQFPRNVSSCDANILNHLTPGDVRQLIIAEDELSRTGNFKRLFPNTEMKKYLKFVESDVYYYKLFDAWETKYGTNRRAGIARLTKLAAKGIHLQ